MTFTTKTLNLLTLTLLFIGGLNWGLMGLLQFDLVAAVLGGQQAGLSRIVYILVGLSAMWQLVPFVRAITTNQGLAEQGR